MQEHLGKNISLDFDMMNFFIVYLFGLLDTDSYRKRSKHAFDVNNSKIAYFKFFDL